MPELTDKPLPYEDPDPGDVTSLIRDVCTTQPIPVTAAISQFYHGVEVNALRRDRDALLSDNARKLEEICALKKRLAALEAPAQKEPDFPLRALSYRYEAVGIFVPVCFRGV